MATVADNLNRIKTAKASIKASIEAKGVAVPADALIDTYASKIDEIQAGGGSLPATALDYKLIGYTQDDPAFLTLKDSLDYTKRKYDEWDPNETSLYKKYYSDKSLIYAPKIDTSKVTDMYSCFSYCSKLLTVPYLDTSKVTNMESCFQECSSISTIPQFDTSQVTTLSSCFNGCKSLISIPQLNTGNVKNMSNCVGICSSLTDIGGFKDLKVSLDLYSYGILNNITKQSLLNVIAGLGQADPAFEAQPKLTLGSTNLGKLTADEIAVGTAKGWQIVA